jgi:dienelactone hydrolase
MFRKLQFSALLLLVLPFSVWAVIHSETIEYKDGETALAGFLVYNDALQGKRPGVIVVHEWWGLNDYAKRRAEMLAELGFVAFAIDMYGDKKVTEHGEKAKTWMAQITKNVDAWQKRALLGLEILKKHPLVNPSHTAAIGYCFGGATVMQMAYAGADLKGVVSFHGSLPPATKEQQTNIEAKVLVAQGADDPFVPPERVLAFEQALDAAGADWQLMTYGGVAHGFTNPEADSYGIDGVKYDERADIRSWALMQSIFDEIFGQRPSS